MLTNLEMDGKPVVAIDYTSFSKLVSDILFGVGVSDITQDNIEGEESDNITLSFCIDSKSYELVAIREHYTVLLQIRTDIKEDDTFELLSVEALETLLKQEFLSRFLTQ